MKTLVSLVVLTLSLALASVDADAARRFGGGGNLGRQRPAPTMREATPQPPPQAPAQSTRPQQSTSPTATPMPAPQPKPSFMSRFGGLLAGLGIGALLGSLFGHGGMGGFFMLLILAAILFMVFRAFATRRTAGGGFEPTHEGPAMREPESETRPVFSGIGSAIPGAQPPATPAPATYETAFSAPLPADFNREAFLRVAKTSFIRLQAANDAKDLEDIRDYTTPEMYAEIAMQLGERSEPQRTEVASLDAQLNDYAIDGDYEIASVRFHGLIRETPRGDTEPFDEIWHVRKKRDDPRAPWLIAGIQQAQ